MLDHNNPPKKESAYKKAGVDIDAASDLIESIKPLIRKTNRNGVMPGFGGYGAFFDLKEAGYEDPILVSSTDGVGTKIKIAVDSGMHDTIGIDAVAMCVNDLIVQGAEPLFFLDYFATGKLENDVAKDVIAGVAHGCEISGCALIGGETAEMPGLYAIGDYDLAGFTVGAVNRDKVVTGKDIKNDDVILGLESNGVHSNGFSLIRKIVADQNQSYESPCPFSAMIRYQDKDIEKQTLEKAETLGQALLAPTRIYVKSLLKAIKIQSANGSPAIKGMAHITGGGLTENIPRIIPDGLTAQIDASAWELPEVFKWLKTEGKLDNDDMARTLNCGIGMIIVCDPDKVDELTKVLTGMGETVHHIGSISEHKLSDIPITMNNRARAWA
ncbi:MAG: phosphoribosylformylglycinamidine cyclo-ligase [Alphaproteobacteria bacterium]|nr:phosphoribosylformylglycinamidine cyclo-ligase [Alphaproteobacteria bacterium]